MAKAADFLAWAGHALTGAFRRTFCQPADTTLAFRNVPGASAEASASALKSFVCAGLAIQYAASNRQISSRREPEFQIRPYLSDNFKIRTIPKP
ncbi:hypothetical protein [Bradyrhizobium sp. URHD0069]|uniref:hypothetical protein n=1 Tax=Bradyrhizobium sp. URHD0069 TaxID=1380355 RepID=UPI00049764BE|nr:hypothetical protein [Bradyrhizobium sp. URHD0069]